MDYKKMMTLWNLEMGDYLDQLKKSWFAFTWTQFSAGEGEMSTVTRTHLEK
jgi:hypothetical protein